MRQLYLTVVQQSRRPLFFAAWGVPDTADGRYEMLVVHAHLLLRRIGAIGTDDARDLAQQTFDLMFADLDNNLREMGVTDTGIGKRIRKMAESFYGRAAAYDRALEPQAEPDALDRAVIRNVYQEVAQPDPAHVAALSGYIRAQAGFLAGQGDDALLSGRVTFAEAEAS